MRWFRTVILLAVPVLAVGCLPTTPGEAGVGLLLALGFGCVLTGLGYSSKLLKVEESKTAARFFLGALFLIGGGLIALGARFRPLRQHHEVE
jgi:hypothetical protein